MRWQRSIQRDLRWRLVAGVLLLGVVAGAAVYAYVKVALLAQFDGALAAKADAVSLLVEQRRGGAIEFEFSPAAMPEFGPGGTNDYFEIRQADGTPYAASPSLRGSRLVVRPAKAGRFGRPFNMTLPNGRAGRAVQVRFVPRPEVDEDGVARRPADAPAMFLLLARDRGEIDRPLNVLLSGLLLAAGALLLGTVALVTATLRRGLQPLRTLAGQAGAIDAGTLSYRFPIERIPQELEPITQRLNDLLSRLQAAFARERRFTSDAAHELRTPIAELRSMAEVALRWPGEAGSGEQNARDALAIAERMEGTVGALLSLARGQAGAATLTARELDVAQAIGAAWQPIAPSADARQISFRFDLAERVVWKADPTLFGAVMSNVLGNAAEHAPAGSGIEVRLRGTSEGFTISIENSNDSLQPADIPHLFEPFWRKDKSRGGNGRHSGLGLALVASFAEILGLHVSAALPSPDRFRITLTPAAAVKSN